MYIVYVILKLHDLIQIFSQANFESEFYEICNSKEREPDQLNFSKAKK